MTNMGVHVTKYLCMLQVLKLISARADLEGGGGGLWIGSQRKPFWFQVVPIDHTMVQYHSLPKCTAGKLSYLRNRNELKESNQGKRVTCIIITVCPREATMSALLIIGLHCKWLSLDKYS